MHQLIMLLWSVPPFDPGHILSAVPSHGYMGTWPPWKYPKALLGPSGTGPDFTSQELISEFTDLGKMETVKGCPLVHLGTRYLGVRKAIPGSKYTKVRNKYIYRRSNIRAIRIQFISQK